MRELDDGRWSWTMDDGREQKKETRFYHGMARNFHKRKKIKNKK